MLQSQKQALRLRRSVLSNLGVLSLLLTCLLASHFGYFVLSHSLVLIFTFVMWIGHGLFVLIIACHVNLRFKDASLTLQQMTWVTLWISVLMANIDGIRPLMMMGYLLVMSFGAFKLSIRGFYGFSFFILACYLFSHFWVYQTRPETLDFYEECFLFLGFGFTLCGFLLMGNEFSTLRQSLNDRHRELKGAVSRIEELAITDELTGLYNRRYLMQVLNQQKALANRSHYQFVVCYIDLDHFKKVNDQYGHAFGDKVLSAFAGLIRSSLREVDVGARLGGEEFVLVLADTQLENALGACKRMANKWRAMHFAEASGLEFSFSAGIVQYTPHESIESTLELADSLLYKAKNNGRDRIEIQ
ncbi:GGDEF domain-containing protein [Oceaniserpentilla sp. 4NH20-0058]|uniref:GGDEF domain-containing protein n=1 Tax=Oceaniserpentilla sp. 4NH20-0058 TaxID=3127660 RepID=UPI003341C876